MPIAANNGGDKPSTSRRLSNRTTPNHSNELSQEVSDQFLIDPAYHYFNTGGLGPTLKTALELAAKTMVDLQARVDHGHKLIEEARPVLAKFIGCEKDELAFTRNATEGNSSIASGFPFKMGDEVILDSEAHQGGSMSWMARQKEDGVVVKSFEASTTSVQENLDRIAALITDKTRVIAISHVTAPRGIRLPAEEIAELAKTQKQDVWFHIDGAQSLGMFPFNVRDLGCDSYAASGHKWMCGPLGTGLLFAKKERVNEITPTDIGSYGDSDWYVPHTLEFIETTRRFECGTREPSTIVGLANAAEFFESTGRERIAEHGLKLTQHITSQLKSIDGLEVLSSLDPLLQSSIVSFSIRDKKADEVFGLLSQAGFRCRPVREQGMQANRISTHLFNSIEQCDRLIEAIKRTTTTLLGN